MFHCWGWVQLCWETPCMRLEACVQKSCHGGGESGLFGVLGDALGVAFGQPLDGL